MRRCIFANQKDTGQVYIQYSLPLGERHFYDIANRLGGGCGVNDDIQLSETSDGVLDRFLNAGFV
jgi:hypothetical protein